MQKILTQTNAKYVILFISFLTIWSAWQLQKLEISYDFEAFFPKNNTELTTYRNHVDNFGSDNDFLLLAIENKNIFNASFLANLQSFTEDLKKDTFTTEVVNISTITQPVIDAFGFYQVPLFNLNNYDEQRTKQKLMTNKQMVGNFISTDGSATVVLIQTKGNLSKDQSDIALQNIYTLIKKHKRLGAFKLAGRIHGQKHFIDLMFWELIIFGASSVLLLCIFLFISFRTIWGIAIPIIVVGCTVAWLLGGLSYMGKSISMLTTIMPTILFVVGVSDVVHLIEKYLEELRKGIQKTKALATALKEIGLATFLTSLTTSIGFLTLLTADMEPIQEFGIYTGLGVWIAYVLAFSLTPAFLLLLPRPKIAQKQQGFWNRHLRRAFVWVIRHPRTILCTTLLVVTASIIGLNNLQVNNYLLEDLNDKDPIKQEYLYFEKNFNGVRPFEANIQSKDQQKLHFDYQLISDIYLLEKFLLEKYGLKNVTSVHTITSQIYQAKNGGSQAYFTKPPENKWPSINKVLQRMLKSKKLHSLVNSEQTSARVFGKIEDFGGQAFKIKNQQLNTYWQTLPSAKQYQLNVTGMAHLIDKNNELLSANMLYGLLIAFGLISIIIALLYKSARFVVIAIIPNMLPLLMVAGLMGYVGIDLKVSTSIIFTIAFGIAVDDTIHFLSKLKLELNKGLSNMYALKRTFLSTGKAIVVTSIILCAGFWTLIFSSFASTFYVGLLISLTLAFAVACDLFLIPILVLWLAKK